MDDIKGKIERIEDLVTEFGHQDHEKHAPTDLVLSNETRDRLADPEVYQTLELAMGYHKNYYKQIAETKPIDQKLSCHKDVPPILGNTIQVIFAYLRNDIDKQEFSQFSEKLQSEGKRYMDENLHDWKHMIDPAFYKPSSFIEKADRPFKAMHVLTDWNKVLGKYRFLMRMKDTYCKG